MDSLLLAVEGLSVVEWLRGSRWGYAAVNAAHILGLALLVGAIVPLDLRLAGGWRRVPLEPLAHVLVPVAATGLALAMVTGAALFSVRATEYASLSLFLVKMALVAVGGVHALLTHARGGLESADGATRRRIGLTSLAIWVTVLACGRLLAFVGD